MINPSTHLDVNDSVTMIATAKNFLSPEECEQIIALSKQAAYRKGTVGKEKNKSSIRYSSVAYYIDC